MFLRWVVLGATYRPSVPLPVHPHDLVRIVILIVMWRPTPILPEPLGRNIRKGVNDEARVSKSLHQRQQHHLNSLNLSHGHQKLFSLWNWNWFGRALPSHVALAWFCALLPKIYASLLSVSESQLVPTGKTLQCNPLFFIAIFIFLQRSIKNVWASLMQISRWITIAAM